jgi:CheY-like chemotaxis protein
VYANFKKGKSLMCTHVLLVDDNEFMAEALQEALEIYNYAVTVATSGDDALSVAQTTTFDVALSDINMPNMDGFMLCESLQERYGIPVVLMTGYGIEDMERMGSRVGAKAILRKPFPLDMLKSTLDQVAPCRFC